MRVCVFCGSSSGRVRHVEVAAQVGRTLAEQGIEVVYGGGRVGTMGALADSALSAGGSVVGVVPRSLVGWEVAHQGLTRLHVVESMHERKALMAESADAFITLPGGAGTLEEFFEVWTWAQLGLHAKPVALLDVDGYFTHLLRMVDHMVEEGFLKPPYRDMLLVDDDLGRLLDRCRAYRPPTYTWSDDAPRP
ncbi:LOG family protein [Saccharothrix hoggarensis]|uniref:Cytokinin riboside 5'-monophosphate phosphoribohydrolase n=1 Tax=Saccharothrix hoggarensis TaxID=913853 RepID=A0ABW3R068_9PSEU